MSSSIEQLLQNLQISGLPTSGSSTKSRQIDIRCPPRQQYEQHYGYRINEKYLLYLESQIKTDPNVFYNPTSLAHKWIKHTLQLHQFSFKYCIDPERCERDDDLVCLEDLHCYEDEDDYEDEDEEEDEFVILVLSVCSDNPASFHARPTQEQMTLLTNLLGSAPQWWVSYKNM